MIHAYKERILKEYETQLDVIINEYHQEIEEINKQGTDNAEESLAQPQCSTDELFACEENAEFLEGPPVKLIDEHEKKEHENITYRLQKSLKTAENCTIDKSMSYTSCHRKEMEILENEINLLENESKLEESTYSVTPSQIIRADGFRKAKIRKGRRIKNKRKLKIVIADETKKRKIGDDFISSNTHFERDAFAELREKVNNLTEMIKKTEITNRKYEELFLKMENERKEEELRNKTIIEDLMCKITEKQAKKAFNDLQNVSFYDKEAFIKKNTKIKQQQNITNLLAAYKMKKPACSTKIAEKEIEMNTINVSRKSTKNNVLQEKPEKIGGRQIGVKFNNAAENTVAKNNTVAKINENRRNTLDINKISPIDLYKKSIDRSKEELEISMLNYRPKMFIPTFTSEKEMEKRPVTARFVTESLLNSQVVLQNKQRIRRLLGDQKEINVEEIFAGRIADATNQSPNKFRKPL
ncbi:hypothetical protein NUSPORA_02376 [Nucleospora cyclopteri]